MKFKSYTKQRGGTMESETWFDQRPSHGAQVPDWVTEAREATNLAQTALDEFHETCGASTNWTSEQASEFERLLDARNAALAWEYDMIEIASHGAQVPPLLVKAKRIERDAARRVYEARKRADREQANLRDLLEEITPSHYATIEWLNALRAYYNGDQGAECACVTDNQSCRYCRAMAAVSNYQFEEE
jgi:hypothetical protein